jgi:rhomboid family GlyGly-CTERM serine protease
MRSLIIETILVLLINLVIYLFEPQANQILAYYYTGIAQFELWRLITATFCHTNFNHLIMNIAGLIITLLLFIDTFKTVKILPIIIFNSIFIGLALFLFQPTVIWYVGLSGVLHGLFCYAAANDIHRKDRWGYLLGIGITLKIIYEQFYGAQETTIELINAPVLVDAHLYGAISGLLFYGVSLLFLKKEKGSKSYL